MLGTVAGASLDVTQELRFSPTVRQALDNGIALRLVYRIAGCGVTGFVTLRMRYTPLNRHYELQREGSTSVRRFARVGALLAALDRVHLPLQQAPTPGCTGDVRMALDLTSLPTPLRFPAFLASDEWRMVAPPVSWTIDSPRA